MNRFAKLMMGFSIAVFIPLGFWFYYFQIKGFPKPLPKYYNTGKLSKPYKFRGHEKVDSIYETIPQFKFVNQNGDTITNDSFRNHIYVANFFFTSCEGICPNMTKSLLKIQKEFLFRLMPILIVCLY
jgi:cytochrome oxidase Cu insertion factor (SCO1/SenC/PrrC family)